MAIIEINELCLYGYHGVFSEEKKLGQRWIVSLKLEINLEASAQSDVLEDTLDYTQVLALVNELVQKKSFNLIEALAHAIADQLLHTFESLISVEVSVHKPHPPLPFTLKSVGVTLTKRR